MKITKATIRQMKIPLKVPFRTSFGLFPAKDFSVVELEDDAGNKGYGECSAFFRPWYNEETTEGALVVLKNFIIPSLFQLDYDSPENFHDQTDWIRKNKMARSSVDCALWEIYSKELSIPEWKALGGNKTEVETGVSLGVEATPADLLKTIEKYMAQGYRRVKCKIKPGKDIEYVKAIRKEFPDIMLMVDANSAYTLKDIDLFKEMDQYGLLMIEQPLSCDDIVDHRHLQASIQTPICLDESILDVDDARRAIELGSCKIINIKVARVGGLTEARKIQKYASEHGVYVWSGGMLDAGIARGHNIAAATLPGYQYPNDLPASDRYYAMDIVTPSTFIDQRAMIRVPQKVGTGFEPNWEVIDKYTVNKWEFTKDSF
ncbi:o-succinylbenzoate synthase [Dialister sp.]|uniref:o-succinylbenzoate synthase n=1 Tax=Dialister sp. TaxID=1955814 RepID=UPI002E81BED8|nr:o-succinylbenzoate synthase [Dialister sp.]MEE3453530.1 o-succinylbenzoate synthase [Dialister sp.]